MAKKKPATTKKASVRMATKMINSRSANVATSDTGITLTGQTIMSYAPMYYAVSRIAGHIGVSDLELRKRKPQNKSRPARPNELEVQELINERPNSLQTGITLKEHCQMSAIVWGNGRVGIIRNSDGEPVELIPFDPATSHTVLIWRDSGGTSIPEKWHIIKGLSRPVEVPDRDVLHIQGIGGDGLIGWSLIELARNSIGGALAAEKHLNRTYSNNAIPGLILEAPEGVFQEDEDAEEFIESFNAFHSGLDRANRVGLLRHGVKANPLSMSGKDAEFLAQRKLAREEAALWTMIESMLGVEGAAAYNSLQQRNQAYLQNCLARWLVKWEQEARYKLLTPRQRDQGYFWRFNTKAILKGSFNERVDTYMKARTSGLMSQEEIRDEEGLDEIDPTHNFGNPNTSAATVEPPEKDENASKTDENSEKPGQNGENTENLQDRLHSVIRLQLDRMICTECNRLVAMSSSDAKFMSRVDGFYATYRRRLDDLIVSLGGAGGQADRHVAESQAQILALLDNAPADLEASIKSVVRSWPTRAAEMADEILGV